MQELDLVGAAIGTGVVGLITYITFRGAKKENVKRAALVEKKELEKKPEFKEPEKFETMSTPEVEKAKVRRHKLALFMSHTSKNPGHLNGKIFRDIVSFQQLVYNKFISKMGDRPNIDIKIFTSKYKADHWGADLILDIRLHPEGSIKPSKLIVCALGEVESFSRKLFNRLQKKGVKGLDIIAPKDKSQKYYNTVNKEAHSVVFFLETCGDKKVELDLYTSLDSQVDDILDVAKNFFEV